MKKNTFSMIDENGNEVVYDVLFTFDNDETGKSYIAYTDNTKDEQGNIRVYANIYDPNGEEGEAGRRGSGNHAGALREVSR